MAAYTAVILILILMYSFYMGFNDGSNAVATATVTRAYRPQTALIVAGVTMFIFPMILYFLGFMTVASTISEGIIGKASVESASALKGFIFVLSGLIAALLWGLTTFLLKLPNSTSHTLIGGILGAGIAAFGWDAVLWSNVGIKVILMVMVAPVIGLTLGFLIMKLLRKLGQNWDLKPAGKAVKILQQINTVVLAGAFSMNNVQKCMGVFMLAMLSGTVFSASGELPVWTVVLFSAALTAGLLFGGYRLVNTLGRKIFRLRPINSLAAQLTTSAVIISVNAFGIPVSTGQIMSSSIMGVGAAERLAGVQWRMAGRIISSWFITLPIVSLLGAGLYFLIAKVFLGGAI